MEPTGNTSEEGQIPKLAEDGRNWKIYHAKFFEVAATERLLSIIAGWESDNGSKDWAHWAEVARMLFLMTTSPLLRLRIRLFESAQQIFRYLTFYFLDFDPIEDPRAKKLAISANEAERVSAATECTQNSWNTLKHGRNSQWQRSHKWDNEEDLSTTKDLSTRGMEVLELASRP